MKLWEKAGFSQQEVSTTGYWQNSTTWIESGGVIQNLTLTQIWMQDDLHPYSQPTQEHLAKIWEMFLRFEI
ncbi:hypothetical protein Q4Q35_12410 [Flavivirga aquimarina]|uniref:Uncharacterized protein n=1 Tax=Flavivirga aquimarina TaxID=2027862 RepID=A0ABT8WBT6_9FLAO|nr:hypothetical protein [Flavivirga aquimarina]MDO5970611.1 hypothetical protein [Flavivirga aquimarina]